MRAWSCAVSLVVLLAAAAQSAIVVPDDYDTIGEAIAAAGEGDTVLVRPGSYRGEGNVNLDFDSLMKVGSALGSRVALYELYYLANAEHLGLGYVEHPPMIGWIAWLARHLLGESMLGLLAVLTLTIGSYWVV